MNKKPLSFYMITTGLLTVFLLLLQAAANFSKPVFYVLVGVLLIFVIGAAFRLKSEFMDYFKSMKLAAALLIYLTIGVVIGTLVLQNVEEARYLEHYSKGFYQFIQMFTLQDTYHSIWFSGLVAMLNLNLVACTLARLPIRKNKIGFFLIHLSILVVVIGGSITALFGVKGYIHMNEGGTYESFQLTQYNQMLDIKQDLDFTLRLDDFEVDKYDPDFRVYAYARKSTDEEFDAPFSFKAVDGETYPVRKVDGELTVDRFFGNYAVRDIAVEQENGVAAAEVAFHRNGREETAHFFDQPGDDRFFLPEQAGLIIFKATQPDKPAELVQERKTVTITLPDGTRNVVTVKEGEIYPFHGSTTMTIGQFIPSFTIDAETRQVVSKSDNPDNPALELILIDEAGGAPIRHWVFANYPEFSHGKKLPGDAKVTFNYTPSFKDKPIYVVSPDGRVTVTENGRITSRTELADGKLVFDDYDFEFKRFMASAVKQKEEFNRSDTLDNPVVVVTWTKNGRSETHRFSARDKQATFLENGRVALVLRNKDDMPKAYRSHMTVLEDGKEVKKHTVEVNDPLIHGGYYFYQSNYNPNDPSYSGIMVVQDPGVYIVFFGFILLVVGGILRFYFKM